MSYKLINDDCDSVVHTHHAADRAGPWTNASANPPDIVIYMHNTRVFDKVQMV